VTVAATWSVVVAIVFSALTAGRLTLASRALAHPVRLRLTFNRSVGHDDVRRFVTALIGLRPPWWKRRWREPVVGFEMTAGPDGLEHSLLVPANLLRHVETALRAHLPSVRANRVEDHRPECQSAVEYRLTDRHRVLTVDQETARRSLEAFSSNDSARSVLQWMITPDRAPSVPRPASGKAATSRYGSSPRWTAADVAAAREKLSSPLFGAVLRLGVDTTSAGAARGQLRHLEAPLHPTAAPGVHLTRRWIPKRWIANRLNRRIAPLIWPITVNAQELSGLLAWPYGGVAVPGLDLAGSRQLPVPDAVETDGTVIGDGFANGRARTAALAADGRLRHVTVVGATGTGKTTLMVKMAVSDAAAGAGVLVVDPKGGDLVDGILERLNPADRDRVAVLDLADHDRPVGFNPLRQTGVHPELAVEHLVGTFRRVWAQSWGQRTSDLLRMALRTAIIDPDATVNDVVPLLTDPVFRRPFMERVTEPALQQFWRQFGALSDGEAAQHVGPVANKLRDITARPSLRRILGQAHPELDIAAHLNRGGVLLVPLNAGQVGEDAAALFGALLLGQVWNGIQLRRDRPGRRQLYMYLDEASRYAHTPVPLEEMLSQARSFGVGITLALQHLAQISPELRHAVMANPRSKVAFQGGAADGRLLAAEFGQHLTAEDFTGLDPYEVHAQLYAKGRTQPAATLTTRPPSPTVASAQLARDQSRARWGVDGDAVDAALAARHMSSPAADPSLDTPTGRKRRAS
jgi:hypothetical protein